MPVHTCRAGHLAVAVALLACACGTAAPPTLALSLSARPKAIDDRGGKAVVSVAVYDDLGQPRGGSVSLTATAGDLGGGGTAFDLDLGDAGTAHLDYTCVRTLDARCRGAVRLDARWTQGADFLETVLRVSISTADAGVPDGGT